MNLITFSCHGGNSRPTESYNQNGWVADEGDWIRFLCFWLLWWKSPLCYSCLPPHDGLQHVRVGCLWVLHCCWLTHLTYYDLMTTNLGLRPCPKLREVNEMELTFFKWYVEIFFKSLNVQLCTLIASGSLTVPADLLPHMFDEVLLIALCLSSVLAHIDRKSVV